MEEMKKKIRRVANVGFYGSLGVLAVTVAEYYLAEYVWERVIVTNEYTHRLLLVAGVVVGVVSIAAVLFMTRREGPQIRQMESGEEKLRRYLGHVRRVYYLSLAAAVVIGAVVVISRENTLIMFLLLIVVVLMINYPNKGNGEW